MGDRRDKGNMEGKDQKVGKGRDGEDDDDKDDDEDDDDDSDNDGDENGDEDEEDARKKKTIAT